MTDEKNTLGRRLKRYAEDQRSDLAYAFLIFRSDDNAMVGGLTLANIRRGVAQAGSIGYWIGSPFARKGYMTAAVRAKYDPQIAAGLVPARRWGLPADVGAVIVPLALGQMAFATGAVIPVDGALSVPRL